MTENHENQCTICGAYSQNLTEIALDLACPNCVGEDDPRCNRCEKILDLPEFYGGGVCFDCLKREGVFPP